MIPVFLLAFIVAIASIMLFAVWWMNAVAKFAIGGRHRLLLEILETRRPPAKWLGRCVTREKLLKKLNALTDYVKMSRFVDSEESRDTLLTELSKIRAEWEDQKE